jgi:SAM-dependent methyltransferase
MHVEMSKWAAFYRKAAAGGTDLMWPNETLVRLLQGSYIPGLDKNYRDQRIVDVSCGSGNNLVFLASLGADLHATEIDEAVVEQTAARMSALGIAVNIRVGSNRALPFADNSMDMLVSWNVIHYEPDETAIRHAIREYARVLRPGGRIVLSTTGPEHKILTNSEKVGDHLYRIGRSGDFRAGQVFFYFDTAGEINRYFAECFDNIEIGRTHDQLMTEVLDWFVLSCKKK